MMPRGNSSQKSVAHWTCHMPPPSPSGCSCSNDQLTSIVIFLLHSLDNTQENFYLDLTTLHSSTLPPLCKSYLRATLRINTYNILDKDFLDKKGDDLDLDWH